MYSHLVAAIKYCGSAVCLLKLSVPVNKAYVSLLCVKVNQHFSLLLPAGDSCRGVIDNYI